MDRIEVTQAGPVKTITLARPEKRNALDQKMLDELYEAFSAPPAAADRVVVLRAQGSVFCAGIDLAERQRQGTVENESPIERVLDAMEHHPLPIVGAVQGAAIAGGNEMALHCDFVVASNEAKFGMSLAQIGLAPTWFLCKKLMEVAGPIATREILLLGDPLPAIRMFDLGIISRVASPQELESEVAAIVDRLAANAPLSLRAMKALIVRQMQFREGIEHADIDAMVQLARASADAREGIASRLEKRAPIFKGA